MRQESDSPAITKQLAQSYINHLHGGDIIGLKGELGSGKTTFVQGLAKAYGITQTITSPTFIILQIYPVIDHPTIKQLCHIDAYRLQNESDARSAGITDYLGQPDTLCVIEWPENLHRLLPAQTRFIDFYHQNDTTRLIEFEEP